MIVHDFIIENGILLQYTGHDSHVTIPDSVTQITEGAFPRNSSIEHFIVPGTIKIIPANAFDGCETLHTVILCEGVEQIGSFAFCSDFLWKVYLPRSINHVESYCFFPPGDFHFYYPGTEEEYRKIGGNFACIAPAYNHVTYHCSIDINQFPDS